MRAKFEPARGSQVTFQLRGVAMTFGAVNQVCMVAGYRAPAKLLDVHIQLVVYFDRTVLEVFASEGLVYFPFPINVNPNDRIAVVIPIAGTAEFHRFDGVQVEIELDAMIEMIEASNQDVRDRRSLRKRATCERLSGGSVAA